MSPRRGIRSRSGAVSRRVPNSRTTLIQKRSTRMVVGLLPRFMSGVPMGAAALEARVERQAEDQPVKEDERPTAEDELVSEEMIYWKKDERFA